MQSNGHDTDDEANGWRPKASQNRFGLVFVVLGAAIILFMSALFIKTSFDRIDQSHSGNHEEEMEVGHKALGQTSNMVTIGSIAEEAGYLTVALRWALIEAIRTLTHKVAVLQDFHVPESLIGDREAMLASFKELLEIANHGIEHGYPSPEYPLGALVKAGRESREHLEQFLGKIHEVTGSRLRENATILKAQQNTIILSFVGLVFVAGVCLMLLRREILERQALQRAEKHIEFLAYHDALTGLSNRSQYKIRLEKLHAKGRDIALLHIDLDDFKSINDTYGHAIGDAVLIRVAEVLKARTALHDGLASRLGGDEFAVVIPSHNLFLLEKLCQCIISDLAEPFAAEGEALTIGCSIGLATMGQIAGQDDAGLKMLSRVTDYALYESKANGRSRYTVYDRVLEQRFLERRTLLEELPRAIEAEDLEVFLQPKVTLPDHRIFGFEALVRWRRDGDLVQPGDFIAIAEESGSILELDHFVLRKATWLVAEWNKTHGTDYSLSANLSALHFSSKRVIEHVENALWHNGFPAQKLTLEITETVEMRDWTKASEVLQGLKGLGAQIAIDDFGTGYSSLAYLKAIMAHELKIDRTLVDELETSRNARVLLGSVLDIAHHLGHEVTVEGIETREQAEIVHELGAGQAQGYFFGRPVPALEALHQATFVTKEKAAAS